MTKLDKEIEALEKKLDGLREKKRKEKYKGKTREDLIKEIERLEAQNVIDIAKGLGGGSYPFVPSVPYETGTPFPYYRVWCENTLETNKLTIGEAI